LTKRKQRKALAQWEDQARRWAHQTARDLALSIVTAKPTPASPYGIGVVLDPGEQVWAECPVRFLQEVPLVDGPAIPPVRPWLITSERIVGRLGDDHLYGWRWEQMQGCRVDLSPSAEFVSLDGYERSRLDWIGPGVAPFAVAVVYRLHGRQALLQHPGLSTIRLRDHRIPESRPIPMSLPTWRPINT
jgi:hypothetical protein